jgi:hypothetical protein
MILARWTLRAFVGLAAAAIAAACGPAAWYADPSMSLVVADRIAAAGEGQTWYGALALVDGRPDVETGRGATFVQLTLAPSVDPGSAQSVQACLAILNVVKGMDAGGSEPISEVILDNNIGSHNCYVPEVTGSPVPST